MICRFCGNESTNGEIFDRWVKPTFTDHDKLLTGDGICDDCLFWFNESSTELAAAVGKDKPQRMRNYSHFVLGGEWQPLSKGDKAKMTKLLLADSFPELAAIANSGQKHIVFRARRNPRGGTAGWIQFEEQAIWLDPNILRSMIDIIEPSLSVFAKTEIESGQYKPHRIMQYGIEQWRTLETEISPRRGSSLLSLALFLAQKQETDDAGDSSGLTGNRLVRRRRGTKKPVSPNNLGTVREYGTRKRLHEQPGKIYQHSLFEDASDGSDENDKTDRGDIK